MTGTARRAAVLGSPVAHSKSPALHRAAYAALGLEGWTYDALDTDADQLPDRVGNAGSEWIGFSVTMPCKFAALAFADERTRRAELVGSANTLVRIDGGWRADCTDIDGMTGALVEVGVPATADRAVVIGAGGTARPTIAALADAGITEVAVVARSADRARGVLDLAGEFGITARVIGFESGTVLRDACTEADVTVSTVPAPAAAVLAPSVSAAARFVDVIYDPWPTPLAAAVAEAGGTVVGGLVMLLNQAYSQVEQFTGLPAPKAAMAAAVGL
ncbi:shikimate dehydrogenase [Gordonia phthalatica]|uniref:shikimate dehydrogenase (NADP(+)) n=1 Tax=Gordonia phthalatica TaxID=1136941 RepID=A0A0N9N289_9ACTN|nr:shikimate dehydrogenase [Gordonia phthalatica]ALG84732.1 shikimate dehydrogenase [Gordonia phthalatica]